MNKVLLALQYLSRPRSKRSFVMQLTEFCDVLDVGCGNNSPRFVKSLKPRCRYTGIDVGDYNQTGPNLADRYVLTSPECFADEISRFRDSFDAVISAHNLEHCNDREATLVAMVGALRKGGRLFLSFPSEESVSFPSRNGTLNYYDDPTHRYAPPSYLKTLNCIKSLGGSIEFSAKNYRPPIDFLRGLVNERASEKSGAVRSGTWAYYGFETVIWARRN